MHEIDYYLSASKKSFLDLAEAIGTSIKQKVEVHNNRMVLPPSLAEGKIEFYEFEDALSLITFDCKMATSLRLKREAVKSNDYFVIQVNLSLTPIITVQESGESVDIGTDWTDAIMFSSTGTALEINLPAGGHFRAVLLIFHRSWALNKIRQYPIPINASRIVEFMSGEPIQFHSNLDLKCLTVAEEILNAQLPSFALPLYLQGCVFKLISLFILQLVGEEDKEERLKLNDVVRVTALKEEMEKDISKFNFTIEAAASKCLMSKTKFLHLFKTVYDKNYSDMVKELKMQRAADLLRQGNTVADSGHQIGYSNLGHFAGAFKEFFHTTPKQYQKTFK